MNKIKKILNNNAILVVESSGLDCVWIGSGIGFQKKVGDRVKSEKIEKRFVVDQTQKVEEISRYLENISTDYLKLTVDIVDMAKEQLVNPLSNAIYLSLADHISNAVYLNKKGLSTGTELSWEVKKLYPREFNISKRAVDLINEQTGVVMNEFEVGNIALHFINAQMANGQRSQEVSEKIKDILTLVRIHNKIELDSESISYDRFVTHLRFFFKRMDSRSDQNQSNPLYKEVKTRYPQSFGTVLLIEEYLKVKMNEDEQLYLCLHIQKLIENN